MPISELSIGVRFSKVLPLAFFTYSPLMKFRISLLMASSLVLWRRGFRRAPLNSQADGDESSFCASLVLLLGAAGDPDAADQPPLVAQG